MNIINIISQQKVSTLEKIDLSLIADKRDLYVRTQNFLMAFQKELLLVVSGDIEIACIIRIIKDSNKIKFIFSSINEKENLVSEYSTLDVKNTITFETTLGKFLGRSIDSQIISFSKVLGYGSSSFIKPSSDIYKFAKKIDELFILNNTIENVIKLETLTKNTVFIINDIYKVKIDYLNLGLVSLEFKSVSEKNYFEVKILKKYDKQSDTYKGNIKLIVNQSEIVFNEDKFYKNNKIEFFNLLKFVGSSSSTNDFYDNLSSLEDMISKLKIESIINY